MFRHLHACRSDICHSELELGIACKAGSDKRDRLRQCQRRCLCYLWRLRIINKLPPRHFALPPGFIYRGDSDGVASIGGAICRLSNRLPDELVCSLNGCNTGYLRAIGIGDTDSGTFVTKRQTCPRRVRQGSDDARRSTIDVNESPDFAPDFNSTHFRQREIEPKWIDKRARADVACVVLRRNRKSVVPGGCQS